MRLLRQRRLFLFCIALSFTVGHAHLTLGQFQVHHHDPNLAAAHHEHDDADAGHAPDRHDQEDAEHMAEHATFAAVIPGLFLAGPVDLRLLASIDATRVKGFEPRAAGIDHPPQLLG